MSGLFKKLVLIFLLFLVSCSSDRKERESISIAVTISPYVGLVKAIAGNGFDVISSIPIGATPHHYEPTPKLVQEVATADYYFAVGKFMQFETVWLEKIKGINADLKIIDLSKNIDYKNNDPHIWLSPSRLKIIAENILEALIQIKPDQKDKFENNYKSYIDLIDKSEVDLKDAFAEIQNRILLTYHGSWEYFADDFEFTQISIESGSKTASAKEFKDILEQAKESNVPVIFIDPQHSKASAEIIARDLGIPVAILNPLPTDLLLNFSEMKNTIMRYYK